MITDPKARKFVDFYLAELLMHVKSMSEHRFTPLEYNLIKKVIVFITQSRDHLSQVEKISSISTLSAFYAFLQKIIEKVQQPDFKKSQMISVIETDSEKLSQIFSQILKMRDKLTSMENEFAKIGLELNTEPLRKEPDKISLKPAEVEKVLPVVKEPIAAKTPPVIKESTPAAKPQILSASEFKKVDDMIGFLSKRKRKTTHENETREDKSPVEPKPELAAAVGSGEGVASDAEDFFDEFRTEFKSLETAVTQLRTNLGRTRYIVEMADSFGEFKRIGKIFELPRFSRLMNSMEKALIDVADNADGARTELNAASFGVIQQLAVLFKEIELQKSFPLSSQFLDEIQVLLESFSASVQEKKGLSGQEADSADNVAELDEELRRSSKDSDEEKIISLAISNVETDDFQVFKEEAAYTFETVQSAVQKLKASGSDRDAIKDLQQSFRSLFTGSRLLRFAVLTGHFDLILTQLKTCIASQNAIAPELLHLIEETVKNSSLLIQGETISEDEWNKLKLRLEKFGTQKELPAGEKLSEFKIPSGEIEKKETAVPVSDTVLASNDNWIREFQAILDSHPLHVKEDKEEKPVEVKKIAEAKPREPQPVVSEAVKPAAVETVSTPKTKLIQPAKEKEKTEEPPDHVAIPTDLVNLMAAGDVDLSNFELPSFIEKLNIEPQNIVEKTEKAGKKKKAVKKAVASASVEEKAKETEPSIGKITEESAVVIDSGRFTLEESNFASVDMEIMDIFNQETEGYFKILDKSFVKLDAQIKDESALKDIERVSHSLKSSSRMLGLSKVSGLAGVIELIAERCNEKELEMNEELRTIMRLIVQNITALLDRKSADVSSIIDYLIQLEVKLSAPNIFVGNIPGASTVVASGAFAVKQINKKAEEKPVAETKANKVEPDEIPILKKETMPESVKTETKMESTENYFKKIGVDEDIVEIFREEASTYFNLIAKSLAALRADQAHETAMRDIEKSTHSLRSSAKMLGFQKIGNVVRPIEVVAEHINTGTLGLSDNILDLFEDALAVLKKLGDGVDIDVTDIVKQLTQFEEMPAQSVTSKQEKRDSSKVFERIKTQLGDTPKEDKSMQKQSEIAKKSKPVKKTPKSQSAYFADIQFTSDPILKQMNKGASELLEEMSHSATQ